MIDPRCMESFERQGLMTLIGAELLEAAEGRAVIEVFCREYLTRQHGYFHGGVVTTIADTACGYAAYNTTPTDSSMLMVESMGDGKFVCGEMLGTFTVLRKTGDVEQRFLT